MDTSDVIKYEEAAEITQVEGWSCKRCQRFYGVNEHLARYCCATELPCECGGRRTDKHILFCAECCVRKDLERWEKRYLKAKPFNEETSFPVYSEVHFRFFYDDCELMDWISDECDPDWAPEEIAGIIARTVADVIRDARFIECLPAAPPNFVLSEMLEDYLPDEDDRFADLLDDKASEIMKQLNQFISEQSPISWKAEGDPIEVNSLIKWAEGK